MRRLQGLLLALLMCLLGLAPAPAGAVKAANPRSSFAPQQLLRRYFAELNAHRFHAAWLLEAPCGISYAVSNGPGSPMGRVGFAGRGAWVVPRGKSAQHPILAAAHVRAIRPLHIPILTRNRILAFAVGGWYRFDYAAFPFANDTHRSGFHVVRIAMWRCSGRWGVEPGYWEGSGGGPLNWT